MINEKISLTEVKVHSRQNKAMQLPVINVPSARLPDFPVFSQSQSFTSDLSIKMRKLTFLLLANLTFCAVCAQETTRTNQPFSCHVLPEVTERGFGRPFEFWKSQIIPYRFGSTTDESIIFSFRDICDSFMMNTNLCFVPAVDETDVLTIEKTDRFYAYYTNRAIYVYGGCGACPHELGHALGLWHEQQRPDRDSFIYFFPENADPNFLFNFQIVNDPDNSTTAAYDYLSMMHYQSSAFSINGQPTLKRKDGGLEMGGGMPTTLDYQKINELYPEKPDCKTIAAQRPPAAIFTINPLAERCEGAAAQITNLTMGENVSFEWRTEGADPSFSTDPEPVISFPNPGSYFIYLKATNAFGSSESRRYIQIDSCGTPLVFDYWNNPTTGQMTLFLNRVTFSDILATAYNMTGQPVYQTLIEPGFEFPSRVEFSFPDNLPSGVYLLRIESENKFKNIKVFLQR